MYFLGYRIQIDIKVVPSTCIFGDTKGESFTNTQRLMSTHDLDILNF